MADPPSITPWKRFLGTLGATLLLFVGTPGVLGADGSMALAILGVGWWGSVVARPLGERRRRALLAELLGSGGGAALQMWWAVYVVPPALLYFVLGWGLYYLIGGVLVRSLRRLPVALAVGLGWLGFDVLRTILIPPFGLGWVQLGHYAHHHAWLAGSARVWGLEGLIFVLAAAGGLVAELLLLRRASRASMAFGLGAPGLGVVLALATSAPETVPGPRVLLVQPGFEQDLKSNGDAMGNLRASAELTLRGIEENRLEGGPEIDLVCWGESMLYTLLFEPEAEQAITRGTPAAPWADPFSSTELLDWKRFEDQVIRAQLLRGFPAGTSFAAGAEVIDLVDGVLRRRVALVQYGADGTRSPSAAKRYLVPGAESMLGLERFAVVRAITAYFSSSFVPDFVPADETTVLTLGTRGGAEYRYGASVCFDNAFLPPYTEPVASGPLDFHLVASNEAWYRDSCEMDQMVAFSRIAAIATGRSFVRATNSGVSVVLGPDGRELGRVRNEGRDRSVPGTLAVTVPVPRVEGELPLYPKSRTLWRALVGVILVAGWLVSQRLGNLEEPPG